MKSISAAAEKAHRRMLKPAKAVHNNTGEGLWVVYG